MPSQIDSEDDFETASRPAKTDPVAIDKKHASITVVVPSSSKEPSPSEKVGVSSSKQERDRINNLAQKEKRLEEAGVTRKKAYQVIADLLDAVRTVEYRDSQGNVKYKSEADMEKRLKGAEMAIKMFGDLIERKEIEYDVGDKTLERFRSLSVSELKARAADLLLGKPVSRLPAIDITPEAGA